MPDPGEEMQISRHAGTADCRCMPQKVQEQLIAKPESYTLDSAMDLARTDEAMITDIEQLPNENMAVDYITQGKGDRWARQCNYCGGSHPPKPKTRCPAYGSQCDSCGKPNH